MVISLRNLYGVKSKMALQDQTTAKEWIEQYVTKPVEGRSELIQLAKQSSLSNGELERIVKSDACGPLQGLATSVLYERKRNGEYTEPVSFNAPYAGVYITVEEDNWGENKEFSGDKVFAYANMVGDNILDHAVVKGSGALSGVNAVGKDYLRFATVMGNTALFCARIEGENPLLGATVQGTLALVHLMWSVIVLSWWVNSKVQVY